MSVQLAVAYGARVIAICSAASSERVKGFGAFATVDYNTFGEKSPSEQINALVGDGVVNVWIDTVTTSSG